MSRPVGPRWGRVTIEGRARYADNGAGPTEIAAHGTTLRWEKPTNGRAKFTATTGPVEAADLGTVHDDIAGALVGGWAMSVWISSVAWSPVTVDFDAADKPVSVSCPAGIADEVAAGLRQSYGCEIQIGQWEAWPDPPPAFAELRAELRLVRAWLALK